MLNLRTCETSGDQYHLHQYSEKFAKILFARYQQPATHSLLPPGLSLLFPIEICVFFLETHRCFICIGTLVHRYLVQWSFTFENQTEVPAHPRSCTVCTNVQTMELPISCTNISWRYPTGREPAGRQTLQVLQIWTHFCIKSTNFWRFFSHQFNAIMRDKSDISRNFFSTKNFIYLNFYNFI